MKALLMGLTALIVSGTPAAEARLAPAGADTRVSLRQSGFGDGPQWQRVRDYFVDAWATVLARLRHRFEVAPVDWNHQRDISPGPD